MIISKGPIHREWNTINWKKKKSKERIVEGWEDLIIETLLSDKKKSEESLIPCKSVILKNVAKKVIKA